MSVANQLPSDIQERLARLQQLQNTLQSLVVQKQRLDIELSETNQALKTLEDVPSGRKMYKSVGAILIEKMKDELVQELEDRKEFLGMRSKVITRQENKTRERLTSLQQNLQKEIEQRREFGPSQR